MSKKPKAKWSWFKRILIWSLPPSVLAGVLLGLAFDNWNAAFLVSVACCGILFAFVGLIWLNVALHEIGHLLAGSLVGYRFVSVQIGGLVLKATESGMRFERSPDPNRDGLAEMRPPDTTPEVWRYRVYGLGGIAVNFLCVVAGALILPGIWPAPHAPFSEVALVFAGAGGSAIAAIMVVTNLAPVTFGGHPTDGLRLWLLRKSGPKSTRLLALQFLFAKIFKAVPASKWPADLVNAMALPYDGSIEEIQARYLRYYWFAWRGEVGKAWEEVSRAASLCSSTKEKREYWAGLVIPEQAFCAAWLLQDLDMAKGIQLPEPPAGSDLKTGFSRAIAALAIREGDRAKALAAIEESKAALSEVKKRTKIDSTDDSDWLEEMERSALSLPDTHPTSA